MKDELKFLLIVLAAILLGTLALGVDNPAPLDHFPRKPSAENR